ncbi:MAG: hypothetical protein A3I05_09910 [Deltaproteobacteria bacterium RIFCSPLOWO2_02_FULL_44_10]|nr:MAG: hypothetical protein A3C46_09275 [Deltaproteobacteria bacterium RIFCSPHIGHO2_02_FULL_44_16]OGQ45008.1 MAG: hypothetical protein A3I05_09910 [Deltaproteobacteria bacterium RIFCSPLOWO2_02_FULL_44_10]
MKRIFIFGVFFLLPRIGFANDFPALGPLTNRIQHPIYLQNLGLTPMRPVALPQGKLELRTDVAFSNLFEEAVAEHSDADLDMELLRTAIIAQLGLGKGFEVGAELPFYRFDGGFLDSFIEDYHSLFHFPRGGRETVNNGRFSYRLTSYGVDRINYPDLGWGVGDVTLHLKHQFQETQKRALALAWFLDFKIPTGQQKRGLSSGSPDFGLGVALEKKLGNRFHLYANAGPYITPGNSKIEDYMYEVSFQFMVAGDINLYKDWSVIAQLQGGSPLLKSLSDQWGGVPLDLIVGLKGDHKELLGKQDFIWQFGFAEDITGHGPSVDFTLFASIGIRTASLFGK